jgi:phosphoribosylaminoimidazole carboxylase
MVNEVAPRPHNSGHYTIEAVPHMSQYKAQIHAVLDLPVPSKLTPRVPSSIMLNILGGATPSAHLKLAELARNTFDDEMDVYLHLYNKASKPGRKIGHITLTGTSTIQALEAKAQPFIDLIDQIRVDRLAATAETLRPKQEPAPTTTQPPSTPSSTETPLVLITMGSDSDLPVLSAGLNILREFGVPFSLDITSAHRTPKYMMRVADEAAGRGIKVIIAAAGGAAHLPGMISSETPLPVIGVPVKATHLDGMDSLLSIVQMPVSSSSPFLLLRFLLSSSSTDVLTGITEGCADCDGGHQQLDQRRAVGGAHPGDVCARVSGQDEALPAGDGGAGYCQGRQAAGGRRCGVPGC